MELSRRQLEVAECVARGMPDKRIAAKLHLSINTVRRHVQDAAARIPGDTAPRHRLTLFFLNLSSDDLGRAG